MGKHGIVRSVTLSTAMTQVLGPSEARVALHFSPPQIASTVTISTDPGAAAGSGMILTQSAGFLLITQELHGDAVKKAWYAAASPSANLGFVEIVEG